MLTPGEDKTCGGGEVFDGNGNSTHARTHTRTHTLSIIDGSIRVNDDCCSCAGARRHNSHVRVCESERDKTAMITPASTCARGCSDTWTALVSLFELEKSPPQRGLLLGRRRT